VHAQPAIFGTLSEHSLDPAKRAQLGAHYTSEDETRVIGGGARSKVPNQIKSDFLGVPYVTLNREESSVLGSVILAGYAVGVFDDLAATAQRFTQPTGRTEPNMNHHAYYQPLVEQYIRAFDSTEPVFDTLASMAELPGTE
jgi:xylulokinase